MKKFFEDCLRNLEAVTGLRQLAYWEMEAAKDQVSAEKKLETCIAGMVAVSKQFTDIPELKQMAIIEKMMVEDTTYESLNSRTIYRWLDRYRQQLRPTSHFTEEDLTQVAPPEVAEKYIKEFHENIAKMETSYKIPTVQELENFIKETPKKESDRKKFVIEGIEIMAMNQEEAQKAYDATFK